MIQFDEKTHTYTLDGVEIPSVTHICRFLAYDYKSDRPWLAAEAARRGTAIHEACALIDYGEEPEETPEISGYLKAYRRFLSDYQPDWELIEHPMGDIELGYAGTLDRYGVIGDRPCILDIKTGQIHPASVQAQLTAYKFLFPHEYNSIRLFALKLCNGGTYVLIEFEPDYVLFSYCLYINRVVERKKKRYERRTDPLQL